MKLHDDDFFDEEDAEVLRFDSFDDAVECCADLNIPFFVDAGNKKLVFWFVRVDDVNAKIIGRFGDADDFLDSQEMKHVY